MLDSKTLSDMAKSEAAHESFVDQLAINPDAVKSILNALSDELYALQAYKTPLSGWARRLLPLCHDYDSKINPVDVIPLCPASPPSIVTTAILECKELLSIVDEGTEQRFPEANQFSM